MYIVTGDNGCRHVLVVGVCTWPTLVCLFVDYVQWQTYCVGQPIRLRYADKCTANIMKVYIERNDLQLELIRYPRYSIDLTC